METTLPFIGAFLGLTIGGAWVNAGPPMAPPVGPAAPKVAPRPPMRAPVATPRMAAPKMTTVQKPVVTNPPKPVPSSAVGNQPPVTSGVVNGTGALNASGTVTSNGTFSNTESVHGTGTRTANGALIPGTANGAGSVNGAGFVTGAGTLNGNGTVNGAGNVNGNGAVNANATNTVQNGNATRGIGTNSNGTANAAANNATTNSLKTNSNTTNATANTGAAQAQSALQGANRISPNGLSSINNAPRTGFGPSAANQTALNQGQVGLTNSTFPAQLQQQLSLSSAQLGQINQFQSTFNQEMTSLSNRYSTDPQGTTTLVSQAKQQLQQQINSVLTPQQRLNLSQLSGQANPFPGDNAVASPTTNTTANNLLTYGALNGVLGGSGTVSNASMANEAGSQSMSNNNQGAIGGSSQRPAQNGMNAATGTNAAAANTGVQQTGNTSPYSSITNSDVQKSLGLSKEQISKLQQGQLDYSQQLADLSGRFKSDPQGTTSLYNDAAQQAQQRINSVLTPAQRQMFSKLTGVADPNSADASLPQTARTTTFTLTWNRSRSGNF